MFWWGPENPVQPLPLGHVTSEGPEATAGGWRLQKVNSDWGKAPLCLLGKADGKSEVTERWRPGLKPPTRPK